MQGRRRPGESTGESGCVAAQHALISCISYLQPTADRNLADAGKGRDEA